MMRTHSRWSVALAVCTALLAAESALGQASGPTISRSPGQMVTAGIARAQQAAADARSNRPITEQAPEPFGWGDQIVDAVIDQLVEWTVYFAELLARRAGLDFLFDLEFDFDGDGVTGDGTQSTATNTDTTGDTTDNTSTGAVKRIERTPGRLAPSAAEQLEALRGKPSSRGG